MTLPLLFENEHVVAVDKPVGYPTIPESAQKHTDVFSQLKEQLGQKLFPVHRLDKFVTGVLVFAKTLTAYRLLRQQFSDRSIEKTYLALVHGTIAEDSLFINQPLKRNCSGLVRVDAEKGIAAETHVDIKRRLGAHTFIHVQPVTGRRHQIRSHLAWAGYPIAGDRRYGDKRQARLFPTILLHSSRLVFTDTKGIPVALEASLPMHFQNILERLIRLQETGFDWRNTCPLSLIN